MRCMVWFVPLFLCGCGVLVQYPLSSMSAGVWAATGKGPADHALSGTTQKDCELMRILSGKRVCHDKSPPPIEDRQLTQNK